ncbi:uncharacterized protein LOC111198081 isoform X4 [Brassica napus]|uniref:uncharacterized protein LOC111198081 isoform X4 n=1 Tax=Brassica napus TaxID=3708 RepID=UPI000BBF13BB|nr:uncharacterized protein LOC111198081 isoform X4 [Brassica napus]
MLGLMVLLEPVTKNLSIRQEEQAKKNWRKIKPFLGLLMLTILLLVIGLLIDAYSFSNRKTTYVDTHHVRCSHNQIIYCKYFTISKIATLTCHTYRVMYVAVSPDGQTIVTGAGDETVRFWNVFPSMKTQFLYAERGIAVGSAQRIWQDSISVLIGPTRRSHCRSPGGIVSPCTGMEIIGVCLEARNIKQLEIAYRNKVWCRRRF